MLKIRLKRVGRKNDPSFRLVVVDSRRGPKSNKFVEQVGFYNPKTKERDIKKERVSYWIGEGAQPSGTVHNMLVTAGVIDDKKVNMLPRKSPVVKEKETDKEKPIAADNDVLGEAVFEDAEAEEQTSVEDQKTEAPKEAEEVAKSKKSPREEEQEKTTAAVSEEEEKS